MVVQTMNRAYNYYGFSINSPLKYDKLLRHSHICCCLMSYRSLYILLQLWILHVRQTDHTDADRLPTRLDLRPASDMHWFGAFVAHVVGADAFVAGGAAGPLVLFGRVRCSNGDRIVSSHRSQRGHLPNHRGPVTRCRRFLALWSVRLHELGEFTGPPETTHARRACRLTRPPFPPRRCTFLPPGSCGSDPCRSRSRSASCRQLQSVCSNCMPAFGQLQ
jgi:hypothetical protein